MSIFSDVLKSSKQEETQDKKEELIIPEGISFTDANGGLVVFSVQKDILMISKFDSNGSGFHRSDIILKKDFIPVIGDILLDFYKTGNLEKSKKKIGN